MTLIFDLVGQGHLLLTIFMMWRYMSKSASSDKYLMSFIKLNFIYLSTAENNNFILICVKFKSLYYLSQSYQISSKSFLKPMALVNHSICSWPRLIVWMFVIKTFVINCSIVSNSDSHIGDQGPS